MNNHCAACGDPLPPGAQFCIACGAPVAGAPTGPTLRLAAPEVDAALEAFAEAARAAGLELSHAQLTELATGYAHALIGYPESRFVTSYTSYYLSHQGRRRR